MSLADYAREHSLKRVGARPSLSQYIAQAWERRDFAVTFSVFSTEAANARNRLGRWWLILLPTIQAVIYGLIFGFILGDSRPDNFVPFLFTGVFLFSFFSNSLLMGAGSITGNSGLVKSLHFPRMLLPLSAVIRQFINLLPQIALLILALIIFGQEISIEWIALIPILFLMFCFATGLALVSARLTVHIQDLSKLIPFVTRVAFYVSGIFFSVDKVLGDYPTLLAIMRFNPIYDFIELARGALVNGYQMTPFLWWACTGWAFGLLIFGLVFFWKVEERYGRED